MRNPTVLLNFQHSQELLAQATQLDALACIHAAQSRVCRVLFQVGASERLIRLARSDLLETLLARASTFLSQDPAYPARGPLKFRERFMVAHLEISLASWLQMHAWDAHEVLSTGLCLRVLAEPIAQA